jgi:hypothetical protein
MEIKINETYTFNHKEGNVLEKYDGTQCKIISKDNMHNDMYFAEMCDGRKIQVYTKELSR